MRTRSQPASPGGLVSLDDMQRATRRMTRSASRGPSQEPTSQQPSTEQPSEPVTQPTTRSKSQPRTTKKTATTKKTTSVASKTKPQTRKGSKRGTRSASRKTNQAASEEAQESIGENYIEIARMDNENDAEAGIDQSESGPSTDVALLEPKNTEPNRKRSRTETSPDMDAEPVTPHANKRRNLGPPGSTPYARRTNRRMSRAVPLTDRQRRRTVESEGRIHSTIFRLPEYVAQTEADRRASETSASPVPPSEPLQTGLDLSSEQDQTAVVEEEPTAAQAPSTPETPRRSWRGLFGSVPRSFSRLLPRFGRGRARSEAPATQQPASERIQRTRPVEASPAAATEAASPPRRRSSEEPPAKRPRNLSYSLFPAPIDRKLFLGDIPTKSTATAAAAKPVAGPTPDPASEPTPEPASGPAPALQPAQQDMPQKIETQPSTTSTERGRESTKNNATETQKKKRKRSPSPDVIPNPVGCSYGMDLDYFCYSSEDEDEAEPAVPQTEPRKADTLGKTALRNLAQTERPASKKVRFDASPEDTPSKRRARATDPYNGTHFIGMGGPQTSSAPTTPTAESRLIDPRQRPGFIPNRSGTFELDYDAFSDDSDSSGSESPSAPAPAADTTPPISKQPDIPQSAQPSSPRASPRPAARAAQALSTPAKVNPALDKARSEAERYKPKTPSGLRTASRYSSPLTAPTPDLTPAQPAEKSTEKFGDDKFAKDAQWLYENCPSGDLRQLVWPERQAFGEGLNVSADSLRILDEIWDPAEVDNAYDVFQREYADFQKTNAIA